MGKYGLGFTLIELVIAITVTAVIAIIAIPKFFSYTSESYIAQAEEIAQNFEQSVRLTQYRWIANGNLQSGNDVQGFANDQLDVNLNGFPIGINKNNPMAQPNNIGRGKKGCNDLWNTLLIAPPSVSHNKKTDSDFLSIRYSSEDSSFQDACYYINKHYQYTADPLTSGIVISYNSTTGEVIVITHL
ncbi:type II secretion system protein [Aliivibrio fischeri]|uniref:type II secretion system protein n=1 Tax=Aliivibrio fischeri TaxID=668 RepID=UPI0007C497FB|nr:prepilin-type N-terminal cleavage/methylation domain-containing protein [Aliivibrio fischeri]